MVTYDLCFLICLLVFLFGVACGIVVGIKAEDTQREHEKIMQESEKQGKWILLSIDEQSNLPMYQCSVCKVKRFGASRYCANCGAKMKFGGCRQ